MLIQNRAEAINIKRKISYQKNNINEEIKYYCSERNKNNEKYNLYTNKIHELQKLTEQILLDTMNNKKRFKNNLLEFVDVTIKGNFESRIAADIIQSNIVDICKESEIEENELLSVRKEIKKYIDECEKNITDLSVKLSKCDVQFHQINSVITMDIYPTKFY